LGGLVGLVGWFAGGSVWGKQGASYKIDPTEEPTTNMRKRERSACPVCMWHFQWLAERHAGLLPLSYVCTSPHLYFTALPFAFLSFPFSNLPGQASSRKN